jgi:hypothetical protein
VFSKDASLIANVIPAMENIMDLLDSRTIGGQVICKPIRAALRLGKAVMEKYYIKYSESNIYRIAMSKFSSSDSQVTFLRLTHVRFTSWSQV